MTEIVNPSLIRRSLRSRSLEEKETEGPAALGEAVNEQPHDFTVSLNTATPNSIVHLTTVRTWFWCYSYYVAPISS